MEANEALEVIRWKAVAGLGALESGRLDRLRAIMEEIRDTAIEAGDEDESVDADTAVAASDGVDSNR
jgi:hypothetical protein